jgi:hypothetical protein
LLGLSDTKFFFKEKEKMRSASATTMTATTATAIRKLIQSQPAMIKKGEKVGVVSSLWFLFEY